MKTKLPVSRIHIGMGFIYEEILLRAMDGYTGLVDSLCRGFDSSICSDPRRTDKPGGRYRSEYGSMAGDTYHPHYLGSG